MTDEHHSLDQHTIINTQPTQPTQLAAITQLTSSQPALIDQPTINATSIQSKKSQPKEKSTPKEPDCPPSEKKGGTTLPIVILVIFFIIILLVIFICFIIDIYRSKNNINIVPKYGVLVDVTADSNSYIGEPEDVYNINEAINQCDQDGCKCFIYDNTNNKYQNINCSRLYKANTPLVTNDSTFFYRQN